MLHILGSVDKPTAGKVLVDGEDISKLNPTKSAIFRRISDTFQAILLFSFSSSIKFIFPKTITLLKYVVYFSGTIIF